MKSEATKTVAAKIECRDCGKVNGPEVRDCGHCGAHLYMDCHKCGTRNPRVQIRCSNCGHRLLRSSHDAHLHHDTKFKLLLAVVVLVALYFVVRWLAAPPEFPALPPAEPIQ